MASKRVCGRCGSPLRTGGGFCEVCGAPAISADAEGAETERLGDDEKISGIPRCMLIDCCDGRSPTWAAFYDARPGELLSADRGNAAIPLCGVIAASVTFDEEPDKLDIELVCGQGCRALPGAGPRPGARPGPCAGHAVAGRGRGCL